jgi:hypothetical protein
MDTGSTSLEGMSSEQRSSGRAHIASGLNMSHPRGRAGHHRAHFSSGQAHIALGRAHIASGRALEPSPPTMFAALPLICHPGGTKVLK